MHLELLVAVREMLRLRLSFWLAVAPTLDIHMQLHAGRSANIAAFLRRTMSCVRTGVHIRNEPYLDSATFTGATARPRFCVSFSLQNH